MLLSPIHIFGMALCLTGLLITPAPAASENEDAGSAFAIRGLKGLFWDGIEKYNAAVPWMAEHDMNWLMLCYTMYPESARDWRKDYTPEHLAEMKQLVTTANDKRITVALSFNPGIWSNPPLCHSCEADYQKSWRKVTDAHSIGIYTIALCLDDIAKQLVAADKEKYGTLEAAQVAFTNRLWADMKTLSPRPKLIFCPSAYTTKAMHAHPEYTRIIGEQIDPEIQIFWTGPDVVSETITVAEAKEAERLLGRQPFVWDNYPVNDMFPWRPLLTPLQGRDPNLAGAVSGILFNPMKQWEASKIPMVSIASYLSDPTHYNPEKGKNAILEDYPQADRPALYLLLQYYGYSFTGDESYPPGPKIKTSEQAQRVAADLTQLREHMSATTSSLNQVWENVRDTVEADISSAQLIKEGSVVFGGDLHGGARDLAVKAFGKPMGLIYAEPTGKSKISGTINVDNIKPTRLRLFARKGEKSNPGFRIQLNGQTAVEGIAQFPEDKFGTQEFAIPPELNLNGTVTITIENTEPSGGLGMPPWIAVKWAQLLP